MLTTMLPTVVIFLGAPLLIWWLRRSRTSLPGSLRVVSRTALTRNGVVAVVETDGRRFLLGATDHGISMLSELAPDGNEPAGDEAIDTVKDDVSPAVPVTMRPGPGTSPIEALRDMTVRRPTRPRAHRART